MFAVIKTGGKQYKVAAADQIEIERLPGAEGDAIAFENVLMVGGEGALAVGEPLVAGASVAGEIVRQSRGERVVVFKKRRRKNSKRTRGHRQDLTVVRITEILTDGAKPAKAKPAKKAKAQAPEPETPKPEAAPEPAAETAEAAPAPKAEPEAKAKPAGEADDLKKISGVGPVLEKKLHDLGVTTYAQIAAWSADDIARVDDALNFKGRIERDGWIDQAKSLMAEKD